MKKFSFPGKSNKTKQKNKKTILFVCVESAARSQMAEAFFRKYATKKQDYEPLSAGTCGGEFHPEFGPREGDVIVLEHWAQSGFANTDLDSQLKQRGIQKIILVGMIANTCI
jgi:nicotinamidase-related amidase